jgi:hypothetical protein
MKRRHNSGLNEREKEGKVFLACGIDLYEDPCSIVVLDKTGMAVRCENDIRREPQAVAYILEEIACEYEKVLFCALTKESVKKFPEFLYYIRGSRVVIKTYERTEVLRMKNMLKHICKDIPPGAYSLAKIIQSEALDFVTFRREIKDLYRLRESLDRLILSLSTLKAFPDEFHILRDE